MSGKRTSLELQAGPTDDRLELWQLSKDELTVSVDNPWAGSTETGFGYTCTISVSREQAAQMVRFICEVYDWKSIP